MKAQISWTSPLLVPHFNQEPNLDCFLISSTGKIMKAQFDQIGFIIPDVIYLRARPSFPLFISSPVKKKTFIVGYYVIYDLS